MWIYNICPFAQYSPKSPIGSVQYEALQTHLQLHVKEQKQLPNYTKRLPHKTPEIPVNLPERFSGVLAILDTKQQSGCETELCWQHAQTLQIESRRQPCHSQTVCVPQTLWYQLGKQVHESTGDHTHTHTCHFTLLTLFSYLILCSCFVTICIVKSAI